MSWRSSFLKRCIKCRNSSLGKDDFPAAQITRTTFSPSYTDEEISLVRAYRKADDTKRQIVRLTLGL